MIAENSIDKQINFNKNLNDFQQNNNIKLNNQIDIKSIDCNHEKLLNEKLNEKLLNEKLLLNKNQAISSSDENINKNSMKYIKTNSKNLNNHFYNNNFNQNDNDSNLNQANNLNNINLNQTDDDVIVKAIFICEFHVTAGRKIKVQVPENYMSKEKFQTVNRYVIPQVELSRSFLCLSLLGIKILGYPVRIDHAQYARNAFYFNVCFVFAPTTRTVGYEPVVKKLSEYLLSMENSNRLLSQQNDIAQLGRLARILTQVRNDINSKKMCMLQEGSTLIPMCVVPTYRETVKISPHHAVALTDNFYKYVRNQWDLTTLRILPYIDGFNHISRITALAEVAVELACDCVKHLVILDVAVIVPVFQYSNVYRPTPKLSQLAKCPEMQKKCIQKCSKSANKKASVRNIFRIFSSMAHGATFGELCVRFNPAALNINEKQMVLFGQIEGLIRRVEKYPITVKRDLFADDIDNITKRKLNLGFGQIPNTPAFEQQQSQISTNSSILSNNSVPLNSYNQSNSSYNRSASNNDTQDNSLSRRNSVNKNFIFSKPIPRNDRKLFGINSLDAIQTNQTDQKNKKNMDDSKLNRNINLQQQYNGFKSFDEICCANNISCQQLDYFLARDKHVIVLLK